MTVSTKSGQDQVKDDEEFKQNCVVHINQLEEDLQAASKKAITSGYIFDPTILQEAAKWFDNNVANQMHQKGHYEKITHFIDP